MLNGSPEPLLPLPAYLTCHPYSLPQVRPPLLSLHSSHVPLYPPRPGLTCPVSLSTSLPAAIRSTPGRSVSFQCWLRRRLRSIASPPPLPPLPSRSEAEVEEEEGEEDEELPDASKVLLSPHMLSHCLAEAKRRYSDSADPSCSWEEEALWEGGRGNDRGPSG